MSTIQVSIWGIKDGFEHNGIYHTHDLQDVKRLWIENDSFRDFSSQDCYIIQYTGTNVVVSLYHPKIKEYAAPGKQRRPGYVIISLIIPAGKCFTHSPVGVLKRILSKYKEEIVDPNQRNISWTYADLEPFIQTLSLQLGPIGRRPEKKYLEFSAEEQIVELLKCDKAFTNFEEVLLVPNGTLVRGRSPLNLELEEVNYIKQQEEDARQKEAERQLKEKLRLEEDHIRTLCAENKWDDALQRFNLFNERNLLPADLQQKMEGHAGKQRQNEENKKKKEADERKLKPLNDAIRNGDAMRAVDLYDSLFFQDIVPADLTNTIYQFKKELAQQREEEKRKRKEIERKKKLYIFLGVGTFSLIAVLFSFSFLLSWPTFMYDRDKDGIVNAEDQCPEVFGFAKFKGCPDTDKDGIGDNLDECPDKPGTEKDGCPDTDKDGISDKKDKCPDKPGTAKDGCPEDSLKNVILKETTITKPIDLEENKPFQLKDSAAKTLNLFDQWVWFEGEKWYRSEKKTKQDKKEIKSPLSHDFLEKKFKKIKTEVSKNNETHNLDSWSKNDLMDFNNNVAICYSADNKCQDCIVWDKLATQLKDTLLDMYNNIPDPCTKKK
jgi:hypothetical protein